MKAGWSLIALAAGSLLFGGAQVARADQHRSGQDWNSQGYRQDQRGRQAEPATAWNGKDGARQGWGDARGVRSDRRGEEAWHAGVQHPDGWDQARAQDRHGWHASGSPFAYVRAADGRYGHGDAPCFDHNR